MDLNEAVLDHMTLHHAVTEYAKKPNGALKVEDLQAHDRCHLGRWLSTDGAAYRALAEHASLEKEHAAFHKASAETVRRADAGTLDDDSLGEKGELKASFTRLCLAMTRFGFKIG